MTVDNDEWNMFIADFIYYRYATVDNECAATVLVSSAAALLVRSGDSVRCVDEQDSRDPFSVIETSEIVGREGADFALESVSNNGISRSIDW